MLNELDDEKVYVIEGECVPKARPKYNRWGGTYGKAHKRQKKYENHIKASLIELGAKKSKKALEVTVHIYKGFLKSWTKKQLREAKNGELLPVKRPDVDNYVKSVLDGAEGQLFEDDSQIVKLVVEKRYEEVPRVELRVKEVG